MQYKERSAYIDNIRVFLTIMVILVHTAVTYGGEGGWYVEEPTENMLSIILLTLFNAVNQSYFMSLFFLISGFFCARSLDRQTAGAYAGSRLLRLGLPLIVFTYLLNPLTNYVALLFYGGEPFVFSKNFHVGPMWFPQALLLFTAVYLILRSILSLKKNPSNNQSASNHPFTTKNLLIFTFVMILLTFVARAIWPMGEGIWGMQLGSFPQYIMMFSLGIVAWRKNGEDQIDRLKLGSLALIAGGLLIILPVVLILGEDPVYGLEPFMGGTSWQAVVYAIWESIMCILLSLLVLRFMKSRENSAGKVVPSLSRSAYAVYIIHPPVLVLCSGLFLGLHFHPLLKFLITGGAAISLSYGLAALLVRIPGLRRVI